MNVAFTRNTSDLRPKGVLITAINGKPVTPVLIYASSDPEKERTVAAALNSGLLGRITAAILKS